MSSREKPISHSAGRQQACDRKDVQWAWEAAKVILLAETTHTTCLGNATGGFYFQAGAHILSLRIMHMFSPPTGLTACAENALISSHAFPLAFHRPPRLLLHVPKPWSSHSKRTCEFSLALTLRHTHEGTGRSDVPKGFVIKGTQNCHYPSTPQLCTWQEGLSQHPKACCLPDRISSKGGSLASAGETGSGDGFAQVHFRIS